MKESSARKPSDPRWDAFMEVPRDTYELENLVKDPATQSDYAIRALEVLLSPDIRQLPYQVNLRRTDINTLLDIQRDLDLFRKIQHRQNYLEAAANFVVNNIKYSEKHKNGEIRNLKPIYNKIILDILENMAFPPSYYSNQLFEKFNINDIFYFYDYTGNKKYDPLEDLLLRKKIPYYYKKQAVERVHYQILKELEQKGLLKIGKRKSSKTAVRYSNILSGVYPTYYQGERPISTHFFAEEIDFLLVYDCLDTTFDPRNHIMTFDWQKRIAILEALKEANLIASRDKFFRICVTQKSFHVTEGETLVLANEMLKRFTGDKLVVDYLDKQLREYETNKLQSVQLQFVQMQRELEDQLRKDALKSK